MKAQSLDDVRRILVLNRNHIGDCLLTTPMLRALKRRFPRAHLAVSVPPSNRDLLVTNPHVDEIVLRPEIQRLGAKIHFARQMRASKWDLIISLQEKSLFYAWATWYSGAYSSSHPFTVSLEHPRTQRLYQSTIPVVPDRHEVYKYLDIAHSLGCPRDRNPVLELEPTSGARERAEAFIKDRGFDSDSRFIGINPGGTKPEKRWPVARFAQVADRLHAEMGLPVMILGGPSDTDMAEAIVNRMSHRPLVAAGRTSLTDSAAMLERCQFLVTGDTGPMHMAVALAVPVVALFGPTNPKKFGRFTKNKIVLKHEEGCGACPTPCIHTISADECVEAAHRLYTAPPVPRRVRDHR